MTCPHCGKEFVKKVYNQKYCNWECQQQANVPAIKARWKAKHVPFEEQRQCVVCSASFVARGNSHWQSTCSSTCDSERRLRYRKEYTAVRRARYHEQKEREQ
jgi:hypothetical protein